MADAYTLEGYTSLDVKEEDGDTTMAIAGIRGVSLTPNVSIEHLDTADSIKADTRIQHSFRVGVDIEYAKFSEDADIVQQWLAGSGGGTSTSFTDTHNPQTFSIDGVFDSVGANRTLSATVELVTFEEMPIVDFNMQEFGVWNLSGVGEDLTALSVTDNTV